MASAPTFPFHQALLRPVVLQILRATGYAAMKPSTLDAFTDISVRYLESLCERLAEHANNNDRLHPSTVDMRMALEDLSSTLAQPAPTAHMTPEEADARGMDEFLQWFLGPRNKTIRDAAAVDGDPDATDYLSALKKKHSKTGEDSKYHSTILGKGNDQGEVLIEGGSEASIAAWQKQRFGVEHEELVQQVNGDVDLDSRPPSSGLSSVGDRLDDEDMDLS